ncbi:MAG: metallophosphoesterase [Halanaerobiaceae bacterium]
MNIYAIGDLHLSFEEKVIPGKWDQVKEYKTMNIFGDNWEEHYRKIYLNWKESVGNKDLVLIPGDISWAKDLDQIEYDIDFINHLPGKKVFIKGNHDYWWQGISRARSVMPDDFYLLQNDSICFGNICIGGSRGWIPPNNIKFSDHDQKIYKRELIRLELSLKTIKSNTKKIVLLHYMPVNENHEKNEIVQLLVDFNIDICLYGHLHGEEAHQNKISGTRWGIEFALVSADYLNFNPKLII